MKFKLVRFQTKFALRKILRSHRHNLQISSIYKLTATKKKLTENSQTNSLLLKTDNINYKNYILLDEAYLVSAKSGVDFEVCDQLDNEEELIYKWALSEVLRTVDFIKFEHETNFLDIGRVLYAQGYYIIRTFEHLTDLMTILNYTKDSFSDGGRYTNIEELCKYAEIQIQNGATILDLGVESTNPLSKPLDAEYEIEQLSLVLPEILSLKEIYNIAVSIDTYHNETVNWLLGKEIDIINDVSGNVNLELVKAITLEGRKYIAMHSLVIPATKGCNIPIEQNPIDYIYSWMESKLKGFDAKKINLNNIILDPGIGFGTLPAQSWYILRNFKKFYKLPCEILVGHSRKSFLKHLNNKAAKDRDLETALIGNELLNKVDYLRIHDVKLLNEMYRIKKQLH
ncbi:MAG: dihydropteroate synthase [Neisseriaceae bacterium]